jgi:hypothetical protein
MDKNSVRAVLRRNRFTTRFPEAIGSIGCSAIRIVADLVGGIGRIGAVARIVVGGMIAAAVVVVVADGTIMEYVLTIVVGAMAGATTD